MGGPIAISYEVDGRQYTFGALSEGELAELLPDVEKHVSAPVVVIPDGLADIRERLPVGTRVRTGSRAQWKRAHGTVTETCEMPGYAHWPEVGPSAWMLSHDGDSVCVRFDGDDFSSWWRAGWIERI